MKHASLFALLVACGGAAASPTSPADVAETTSAPTVEAAAPGPEARSPTPKPVAAPDPPRALPTVCASNEGDVCSPGTDFSNRVCATAQPDVALILFSKGSPWTRLYLKGDVDAWNAEGGASARAKLAFDEEVIVLKHREAPKGTAIVVGASGGYQVMRIDGNCYSLDEGEVTMHHPPRAKHPPIPWRYLTERTRNALLDNASIKGAYDKRGRECKGASVGEVSLACEQADTALSNGIVDAVKTGFVIPTPDKLP
jgi:hypothetical protein